MSVFDLNYNFSSVSSSQNNWRQIYCSVVRLAFCRMFNHFKGSSFQIFSRDIIVLGMWGPSTLGEVPHPWLLIHGSPDLAHLIWSLYDDTHWPSGPGPLWLLLPLPPSCQPMGREWRVQMCWQNVLANKIATHIGSEGHTKTVVGSMIVPHNPTHTPGVHSPLV